jgi:integrase
MLVVAAGVPKIDFHDLRHTSATLLLGEGDHPMIVQERMGLADIGLLLAETTRKSRTETKKTTGIIGMYKIDVIQNDGGRTT